LIYYLLTFTITIVFDYACLFTCAIMCSGIPMAPSFFKKRKYRRNKPNQKAA